MGTSIFLYLMETLVLAAVIGPLMLVMGLAALFHGDRLVKMETEIRKSPALLFLWGFVTLLLGVLVTLYHNFWDTGLEMLVSAIGWIMVVKGVILMLMPEFAENISKAMLSDKGGVKTFMSVWGIIVGALGLYMSYLAYMV